LGGAGGGIDKSTGEGVSDSITALFPRGREDRNSGVELIDLDARVLFFMFWFGFDGRMAGDCFLREGFVEPSSPLGEAVRLFV